MAAQPVSTRSEPANPANGRPGGVSAQRQRLAQAEVVGRSVDGRVRVKAAAGGRVTALRLDDGVLRRYDTGALSDLITRTVRDTQLRAQQAYATALSELEATPGNPRASST